MPDSLTFRDHRLEARITSQRILVSATVVVLLFALIVTRLLYLQVARHEHYITLSQDNRVKVNPLAPTRGRIFSRDGVLLAENRPSFRLQVVPERVDDMEATLAEIVRLIDLTPADLERFRKLISRKRRFESTPLRFNLTEEEVARFAVDRHRFPGVDIAATLSRHYPLGASMAHVVGYVGRIDENDLKIIDPVNYSATTHIGKVGVEQSYESLLHGRVGYEQVEVNSQGRTLRVLDHTPAQPGTNLRLSVDTGLQAEVTAALGNRRAAAVAIDPNTGEVLALVSTPSYDPNPFVNGISAALYTELRDSPDHPLFNRALQAAYPPGSTLKPLLALAGLHYGLRKPADGTWCPGSFTLRNDPHQYRCWQKWGHGRMNVSDAIEQSCDVYFYQLALDLGVDRMHGFLDAFGLGRRTGIDLPREAAGVNPSRQWKRANRGVVWFPGETVIAGIGQGYHTATPLQLAHAAGVMATRGVSARPHVVTSAGRTRGGKTERVRPELEETVSIIDRSYWQIVIEAMHRVVQGPRGTARRSAEGAPYLYAGKTGTSQLFGLSQGEEVENEDIEERLRDHALFIAFAPLDRAAIAVAVVVENGASGSKAAAPVARRILDHYLLRQARVAYGNSNG
ncbi:MAG: penicillin-binding protein 2 [Chromatiales bacterium]